MLFRREFLDGIRDGTITLAFRRWRRPTVREGGTLLTPVGQLHIESVKEVTHSSISVKEARQAGYDSRETLLAELRRRKEGAVYRIELGPLRPDPRIALRDSATTGQELQELRKRLQRLDSRASGQSWTLRVLEILSSHSGTRAGDLCGLVDQAKDDFKRNVRKLKNLGLTESLEIGYRLSPRGKALLDNLRSDSRSSAS